MNGFGFNPSILLDPMRLAFASNADLGVRANGDVGYDDESGSNPLKQQIQTWVKGKTGLDLSKPMIRLPQQSRAHAVPQAAKDAAMRRGQERLRLPFQRYGASPLGNEMPRDLEDDPNERAAETVSVLSGDNGGFMNVLQSLGRMLNFGNGDESSQGNPY